jgi:hypothetical protein
MRDFSVILAKYGPRFQTDSGGHTPTIDSPLFFQYIIINTLDEIIEECRNPKRTSEDITRIKLEMKGVLDDAMHLKHLLEQ